MPEKVTLKERLKFLEAFVAGLIKEEKSKKLNTSSKYEIILRQIKLLRKQLKKELKNAK